MVTVSEQAEGLIDAIRPLGRVVVALSGGVDSSVVAAAAAKAGLESLLAVTANSASVSEWQMNLAKSIAGEIGIEHQIVTTEETSRPEYIRNDGRRCFYCKQTLYRTLAAIASTSRGDAICSGTNHDDLGDYRPGIEAGTLASVRTPLADLQLGKSDVRAIAGYFGLSNADTPASPCLSSRLAYGVPVTAARLQRVERSEAWLRERGFSDARVRVFEADVASVEVPMPELARFQDSELSRQLELELKSHGFREVKIDPAGLRSGNLNQALVRINS